MMEKVNTEKLAINIAVTVNTMSVVLILLNNIALQYWSYPEPSHHPWSQHFI